MFKGIVRLEFVDVETGKINRTHEQENYIFFTKYADLWISDERLARPAIVQRGADIFPVYDKSRSFYGAAQPMITGYIPEGTVKKKFFQKTDNSPAYWDFYSMFLPPAVVSTIPCVGLTTFDGDNGSWTDVNSMWTALNLDPYCYQAPTEYLNVYYRLVMVEDDDNESPDFIRNQFVMDMDRGSNKVIFPNYDHKTYPYRIEEPMNRSSNLNFLSYWSSALPTKSVNRPILEHQKLYNVEKTYTYPDDSPNQYNQVIGASINTVVRGAGRNYKRLASFNTVNGYGTFIVINPVKITPELGQSFTGIGNVFSSAKGSNSTMFDPAYFPIGTGRMQVSGQLSNINKDPFLTTYQCEVQQPGQNWNNASYRVYEYRNISPTTVGQNGLPLLPWTYANGSSSEINAHWEAACDMMYRDRTRIHFSNAMTKYIEDRAFITWDKTGITLYDIYHGKLEIYDAHSSPQLAVTNIIDVKVDTIGNIWIGCADTGLWKLSAQDENTVTLTHIGVLPGAQQKCYGVDVDNFGNVIAIFWGTGPFWSGDGGQSWTNIPIDYAPFSGYEGGGFVSKWSNVAKFVCNPARDAKNGTSQFLFLMKESSVDYAASGGCWYDLQSQLTTGITNTTLKNALSWCRTYPHNHNMAVSDDADTWFFSVSNNQLYWMKFQHNAAPSQITDNATFMSSNFVEIEKTYDPVAGVTREYVYLGCPVISSTSSTSQSFVSIFDINSMSVVKRYPVPFGPGGYTTNNPSTSATIRIGKNLYISKIAMSEYNSGSVTTGYAIHNRFAFSKEYRQWASKQWGWDGGQWKENHPGNKQMHLDAQPLFRGVLNKFTDGPGSTTSWAQGDTYTFVTFDGFYKDNSSTMSLRDTIYYKPTNLVEAFEPSVVTRIDRSQDVGILNSVPIETEWNIDDLPDTRYGGGTVVPGGDPNFEAVSLLYPFNQQHGLIPVKGTVDTMTGFPIIDTDKKLYGDSMVKLDGNSGFALKSTIEMALASVFTIEMVLIPSETGTRMNLLDYRTPFNANAPVFYISAEGRLTVNISGTTFGNIGDFLFPGTQYYIAFTLQGGVMKAFINGVEQFQFNTTFTPPSESPLNMFKRFQMGGSGWEGFKGWAGNVRITKNVIRDVSTIPTGYFPQVGNNYGGAQLILAGNYNTGSIVARKELVGDWDVIFRNITPDYFTNRRQRPKFAFGVSVQKFIESPTDISYRLCGSSMQLFMEDYYNSQSIVPSTTTAVRITKTNNIVNMYYSTNGGASWVVFRANITDFNPVHHICFWQVQKDVAAFRTPSVEIVKNGTAIFSYIGTQNNANGYFHPKFLAADVVTPSDIQVNIAGVPATKKRSNYLDPALPLKGEVLAMMGGTVQFHEEDIGKIITGKMITIHD